MYSWKVAYTFSFFGSINLNKNIWETEQRIMETKEIKFDDFEIKR